MIVGGVADIAYVEVYAEESILNVREVPVIEKLILEAFAAAYVESDAIDALIVHVPGATNTTIAVGEPTVHTGFVALT